MGNAANMDIGELRKKLRERYRNLNKRQRVLLFFGLAVLVFMLGNVFLISPIKSKVKLVDAELKTTTSTVEATHTKIDLLMAEVDASLANPGSARSRGLKSQIDDLDGQLLEYFENLIPASQMGGILQQALSPESGLELLSIRSLQAEKLSSYQTADEEEAQLFRKGIEMTFQGDYFTTIDYLIKLENLKWKLLWGYFEYEVQDYPTGAVTIQVYTLSSEEGWIGG